MLRSLSRSRAAARRSAIIGEHRSTHNRQVNSISRRPQATGSITCIAHGVGSDRHDDRRAGDAVRQKPQNYADEPGCVDFSDLENFDDYVELSGSILLIKRCMAQRAFPQSESIVNARNGQMIHGIYLSSHGANVQSMRQDVIANNLANASTTGFKRDVATFQMFKPEDFRQNIPNRMHGDRQNEPGALAVDRITTDHTSGALQKTGQQYDIGLSGEGFLRVSDGQDEYLTRNGQLHRNGDGELVTMNQGLRVLSTAGEPIQIRGTAAGISIGSDGRIAATMENNQQIPLGQIDLVSAPHDQLRKLGDSLYQTQAETTPANETVQVKQGFMEASGVSPIHEMTAMIETSRAFEANINMIRIQDESLGRLLQSVGG